MVADSNELPEHVQTRAVGVNHQPKLSPELLSMDLHGALLSLNLDQTQVQFHKCQ
jgi:hypothetical protein